jgi:hypothetical protein
MIMHEEAGDDIFKLSTLAHLAAVYEGLEKWNEHQLYKTLTAQFAKELQSRNALTNITLPEWVKKELEQMPM